MTRIWMVCLALSCGIANHAGAQAIPAWMQVRPSMLEESAPAPPREVATPPSEAHASVWRQNRARRILAAGAGVMLAGAITPAYVYPNRTRCYGSNQPRGGGTLRLAAGAGALGFVVAAGGASWLLVESRRHGYHASRRERAIATGIGALTFVLSQAVLGGAFLVEHICSD
jgi:hypothetical protein